MKVETESVKISAHTLSKVRKYLKKHNKNMRSYTIGGFIDCAALEKLEKENSTQPVPKILNDKQTYYE